MTIEIIKEQIEKAYNDFYQELENQGITASQDHIDSQIQAAIDNTTEDEFDGESAEDVYNCFIGELKLYKSEVIENIKQLSGRKPL